MTVDPSPQRLLERVLAVAHLLTLHTPAEAHEDSASLERSEKPASADLCYSQSDEQINTT